MNQLIIGLCILGWIAHVMGVSTSIIQPSPTVNKKVKCDVILKHAVSFYKNMTHRDTFSYNDIKGFYEQISLPGQNYMHQLENRPHALTCLTNLMSSPR